MTADRLPPGAASLIARFEQGRETDDERATILQALRAAADGRPIAQILAASARNRRDVALQTMRTQHFAGLASSTAAKRIAETLRRYASGSWSGDRVADVPPRPGTLRRASFDVLMTGPPPAWRTVHIVLQRYPVAAATDSVAHGTMDTGT